MEWMSEPWVESAFEILIDTTLKGSLIALAVIALTAALDHQRAGLRSLILNLGVMALLIVPILSVVSSSTAPHPQVSATVASASTVLPRVTSLSPIPIAVPVDHQALPIAGVIGLYIAGALLILIRIGRSVLGLLMLNHGLVPVTDRDTLARLDRIRSQLSIRRGIRLARSAAVISPCQMGVRKPVVVLPADRSFEDHALDAILLHEAIHIKRFDCLFKLLGSICAMLYWMNPLVWVLIRKNGRLQDQACDDWVVYLQQAPDRYVQTLVSVVRGLRPSDNLAYQLDMANGCGLLERIQRIRQMRTISPFLGSTGLTVTLTTAAALVIMATSLQIIIAPANAVSTVKQEVDSPPEVASLTQVATEVSKAESKPVLAQQPLVRPVTAYEFIDAPEEPDAWLSPEVLALAPTVEPIQYSPKPRKISISNEDIMIYPEPETYAEFAAPDRLIAPAGASYQTSLTMGTFIGTEFGSRDFYIGSLSGPDLPESESGSTSAGFPINRRVAKITAK
jgi:beta-lactamase regulating signal transducer with metallopeptidase domain